MKPTKKFLGVFMTMMMLVSMMKLPVAAATLAITTQPKTSYTAYNETAKATIKATGDGLKYTWYIKDADDSSYRKSSVTKSYYSTKMTNSTKDRKVYCIVKDAKGKSIKSSTATLRMKATITTEPKTTYAKHGATAKLTVVAKGDGLTYAWYIKNPGKSTYSKSSTTKATYSLKMSSSNHGRLAYCIVKDKYGKTAKSKTVALRRSATIITDPSDVTVANGEKASVKVSAVGDDLTYAWYIKKAGSSSFSKSSITKSTYSVTMSDSVDGRQVYCQVKDKYGKTDKSTTVTLSKKTGFASITTHPIDRTAVEGNDATFMISATGSGELTYQWEQRKPGGSWTKSSVSGNKTSKITVPATTSRDGNEYRCAVTCDGYTVYSEAAKLTVTPIITIESQPQDASGELFKGIQFSVNAVLADSSVTAAYQWQYRVDANAEWVELTGTPTGFVGIGGAQSEKLTVTPEKTTVNGYQFRCAVTANGVTVYSSAAALKVNEQLKILPDPASGNYVEHLYCAVGDKFTLNAKAYGGSGEYSYVWYVGSEQISGTSTDGNLSVTLTLTEDMLSGKGTCQEAYYSDYELAYVEVTDEANKTVKSADYHIHRYDDIAFVESSHKDNTFVDYSSPVAIFTVLANGGNPEFIEYQWQYSFDGVTWADITEATINDGTTKFAYAQTIKTEALQILCRDESYLGTAFVNNGYVWLRCKATDTFKENSVYSTPFAYTLKPTITSKVSNSTLIITSDGGPSPKAYSWETQQGNWYQNDSTTNTIAFNSSRWTGYSVHITFDCGVSANVTLDGDGNITDVQYFIVTK